MTHLKRLLEIVLVPVMAAVVFVEDVLLHYLGLAMAAVAAWPPIARLEGALRRLPPAAAIVAFVAPALLVLPIKLLALGLMVQGHLVTALAMIVAGKVLATALVARLYRVLHPTLCRLPWFVRAETRLFAWRDRLYGFVRSLPAWQKAAALVRRARALMRNWFPARRRARVRSWPKSSR
ncbi:MAG: hypothetical protein U1E23_08575 [Reyranellaceae bacterium]